MEPMKDAVAGGEVLGVPWRRDAQVAVLRGATLGDLASTLRNQLRYAAKATTPEEREEHEDKAAMVREELKRRNAMTHL